jgi:hypothetical protein
MKSFFPMSLTGTSVLGLLLLTTGCTDTRVTQSAPSIDPDVAGKAALTQYDTNHNGKIDGSELDKCPALKASMSRLDTNHDNAISAEEIAERIKFWRDSDSGRRTIRITILHNGAPLTDADVKIVPEKFLGPNAKTATGKTTAGGSLSASDGLEGKDYVAGFGPGFYRVEITKPGEKIPAKYNTDTILGLNNSIDSDQLFKGAVFNLEY